MGESKQPKAIQRPDQQLTRLQTTVDDILAGSKDLQERAFTSDLKKVLDWVEFLETKTMPALDQEALESLKVNYEASDYEPTEEPTTELDRRIMGWFGKVLPEPVP